MDLASSDFAIPQDIDLYRIFPLCLTDVGLLEYSLPPKSVEGPSQPGTNLCTGTGSQHSVRLVNEPWPGQTSLPDEPTNGVISLFRCKVMPLVKPHTEHSEGVRPAG